MNEHSKPVISNRQTENIKSTGKVFDRRRRIRLSKSVFSRTHRYDIYILPNVASPIRKLVHCLQRTARKFASENLKDKRIPRKRTNEILFLLFPIVKLASILTLTCVRPSFSEHPWIHGIDAETLETSVLVDLFFSWLGLLGLTDCGGQTSFRL